MSAKTILPPGQRAAISDPPTDRERVERFYTLGPDELVRVCRRRRGTNRIRYAVQLCYLRHPGRALAPGEAPPAAMLSLLCEQVGGHEHEFEHYAARGPTSREHCAEIEALLGLRAFERADLRAMLAVGIEVAASTDRGETIVAVMVERLRAARVVVPAPSALERVALIARAQARPAAYAGLIRDCASEQEAQLERLIDASEEGRTGLGWIRDWSEAPSATNMKTLVKRWSGCARSGSPRPGASYPRHALRRDRPRRGLGHRPPARLRPCSRARNRLHEKLAMQLRCSPDVGPRF